MAEEPLIGILKRLRTQQLAVRTRERSYRTDRAEVIVNPQLVRRLGLVEGAMVTGRVQQQKGKRVMTTVESVCGMSPEAFAKRPGYADLTAIDPHERFELGSSGNESMRIVDLIAPIGKGTRQLIVSPPKAGKTVLLEQIVSAIETVSPQARILVLLIDERPEEVTLFRRAVNRAEVVSSTIDNEAREHVELSELMLSHIQVELECGRELVVVIDSLTRMARAFNTQGRRRGEVRGHTMSGGLEAGILEIPRRLFGMARSVENGGSVTIIATCLIDTGSRMDQLIFEEFKGTGNSEIVLDRSLAQARIFPAIDIPASGTRKEAALYTPEQSQGLTTLRRVLSSYNPRQAAEAMKKLLSTYPNNAQFLKAMASGR